MSKQGGIAYSVTEGLADIVRNKMVSLLSIATIAVSITVLGVFMLLSVNLNSFTVQAQDNFMLHVFLDDSIQQEGEPQALVDAMEADERVRAYTFISQEAAHSRFQEFYPEEAEIGSQLEAFSLPASYDVEIDPGRVTNDAELQEMVERYSAIGGVDDVIYDSQWQHSLESLTHWITGFGLFLGGLLIFAAIVTTSNIIKLNYLSRKDEIEIMRLVGADGIYIKGPFLFSGIVQGFLASAISLAALFLLYLSAVAFVQNAQITLFQNLNFTFLPLWMMISILLGGPVTGLLASLLTLTSTDRI